MRPLDAHPAIASLLRAAASAGVSLEHAYLVGGVVRDALLGRDVIDVDLTVEGDGQRFARALAQAFDARYVEYRGFGTAAVVDAAALPGVRLDVASARREHYAQPGSLPQVEQAQLRDDLDRRDFTINAIASPLWGDARGELVDPLGGIADLEAGVLRVLHDASFRDDPTRLFRGVRYAARYGFAFEPKTLALALDAVEAGALATVSRPRLRNELELVLEEQTAPRALQLLDELGMLAALGLGSLDDAQLALLRAISAGEGDDATRQLLAWRMRLAVLAAPLGAQGAHAYALDLRMRVRDADEIARHVRMLDLLADEARTRAIVQAGAVELRDLLAPFDDESLELACIVAQGAVRDAVAAYRTARGTVRLTVTGHDLLALGIARGPAVGEVLEQLYDRKLAGELATEAAEREAAADMVARMRDDGATEEST